MNRQSSIRTWLLLALTLALCAPPLFVSLGDHLSTNSMEAKALVSAQETWLRWHEGESGAWLVTSNDGLPRLEKPPLLAWLNFLVWSDLSPQTATPEELTHRARLVSASIGLLLLASIFWLGCTLANVRTAALATLAAGSMFFVQRQARAASYDIHFVAWATLAVAAAIWAMKLRVVDDREIDKSGVRDAASGGGPSHARQVTGWSLAGIALACSVMSKNPLAYAIVLIPLAGAMVLDPKRLKSRLLGLIAAIAISLLPVVPWYWHVWQAYPAATKLLANEFTQPRPVWLPLYYYLNLFGLVLPWTIWLICGLAYPWTEKHRSTRRAAFIVLLWFALIFILFSCPPAKQQRYILPIVPAAALLCSMVLRSYQSISDSGRREKVAIGLGYVVWLLALVVSIAIGPLLVMQDRLLPASWHWSISQRFISVGWPAAIGIGATLAVISIFGWRWNSQWKPMRAGAALGVLAIILTTVYWRVDTGELERTTEVREVKDSAEHLRALTGGAPLRSLRITLQDQQEYRINEGFRFYFGRLIRRITPEELNAFASQSTTPVYVLAKARKDCVETLRLAGYQRIDDHVVTDNNEPQELWVRGK